MLKNSLSRISFLSDVIWEEMAVEKPYMTFEQFEEYSFETPNLFYFVDRLYESLHQEVASRKHGYRRPSVRNNRFQSYSAKEA